MQVTEKLTRRLRDLARRHLLTYNTLRYRLEFPRIADAFRMIGRQGTVLDGGAGGGQMLTLVYQNGFCEKGIGLEYDEKLLKIMLQNHSDIPALSGMLASLLDIPLEDGTVDCAMTTQVLEHIENHERAAAELGRVVKKGGHLIISLPHPPEPFPTIGHLREGYTESEVVALFPEPGFRLIHTGYSVTRPSVDRATWAQKLPFRGMFIPLAWADLETGLTEEERKAQLPYAITCLFQKI